MSLPVVEAAEELCWSQQINSSKLVAVTVAAAGTNATFTVAGTASDASTVTFQWEYSTDGGNTFSTISSLAGHSGETTSTLTVDDDYNYNYDYNYIILVFLK